MSNIILNPIDPEYGDVSIGESLGEWRVYVRCTLECKSPADARETLML